MGIGRLSLLVIFLMGSQNFLHGQARAPHAAEVQKYLEQAQQALRANAPDEAAQAYRSVLKIDPANVDARANLGIVAMVRRDWEGAAEEFRKALKLQPSLWKAQALLGLSELHLGHAPEATQLLSASFPHLQDPKLRLQAGLDLAQIWYQSGELEKAAVVLSQLQQFDPTNADVLYAAYRVYSDQAYHALDSLALVAPDSGRLHRALAQHQVNEGRISDAVAEYRKAVQRDPGLTDAHYEMGQALLLDSHLEPSLVEAQKEFETALAQNPTDGKPNCMLGRIDLLRSDPKAAFEHYAGAQKLNPKLSCANLGLAGLLIDEGKTQEALSYLQSAADADPSNPNVRYRLAMLYRKMGRKEDADRELSAYQELKKVQTRLEKAFRPDPSEE